MTEKPLHPVERRYNESSGPMWVSWAPKTPTFKRLRFDETLSFEEMADNTVQVTIQGGTTFRLEADEFRDFLEEALGMVHRMDKRAGKEPKNVKPAHVGCSFCEPPVCNLCGLKWDVPEESM